jgi:hypothetical protein
VVYGNIKLSNNSFESIKIDFSDIVKQYNYQDLANEKKKKLKHLIFIFRIVFQDLDLQFVSPMTLHTQLDWHCHFVQFSYVQFVYTIYCLYLFLPRDIYADLNIFILNISVISWRLFN